MPRKALLYKFVFWMPLAVPLAMLNVGGVQPLAIYFTWGRFHVPPAATNIAVSQAIVLEPVIFLILIAVPKVVIYFWGNRQSSLRTHLLNMTVYFLLPIMAWLLLPTTMTRFIWLLIAFVAWMDALQIMFTSKLPEPVRAAWHLE